MTLVVHHDQEDLRFHATLGEGEAELTYSVLEDGSLDLDYTFIPEGHRNQGLADQLVKAALYFVQQKNLKFVPSCPVVEAYVKRHPAYQHLMLEE